MRWRKKTEKNYYLVIVELETIQILFVIAALKRLNVVAADVALP